MDIAVFKKISFAAVVVMFGMATAWAGPPDAGRGGPPPPNDFRQDGGGRLGEPGEQDYNQRRGKLSVDERRQLRRQIDEAGQDIYRSKR